MNNRSLFWGLEAGLSFWFSVNKTNDFALGTPNRIFCFSFRMHTVIIASGISSMGQHTGIHIKQLLSRLLIWPCK